MLRQRLITAIILAPILTYLIYAGGWWYGALVLALLSIGTWEFVRLAHGSGVLPARWLMLPGVWALACGVLWQSGYCWDRRLPGCWWPQLRGMRGSTSTAQRIRCKAGR